jgi:hypothetical protein
MPQPSDTRFARDERALLAECKRIGPAGISALNHSRANFATTYSTKFCEVVADLLLLYKRSSIQDPVARLSERFQSQGIESCRGAKMTFELAKYLVNVNVAKLEDIKTYQVLDRLTREKCPVCGKLKVGLSQHILDVHPEVQINA